MKIKPSECFVYNEVIKKIKDTDVINLDNINISNLKKYCYYKNNNCWYAHRLPTFFEKLNNSVNYKQIMWAKVN